MEEHPRKLNESVYEFSSPENPTVEVIFFHGVQLGASTDASKHEAPHLKTWTFRHSSGTKYWPQTLFQQDKGLASANIRVRALAIAYDSSSAQTSTSGRIDIFNIVENLVNTVIDNKRVNVGQTPGVPVILVGHSYGGLVIKKLLVEAEKMRRLAGKFRRPMIDSFLHNVAAILYYATPHLGLEPEVFDKLFPKRKVEARGPLIELFATLNKGSARLEDLLSKTINSAASVLGKGWGGVQVEEVLETKPTNLGSWTGILVGEGTARNSSNTRCTPLDEDHLTICKPVDTDSGNYQILSSLIQRIADSGCANTEEDDGLDLPDVPSHKRLPC